MWLAFLKTISSYYYAYECFLWYTWVYTVFVFETEVSCSIQAKIGRKFNLRHFMETCPHFPEIIWVLWAEAVWELWTGGAATPHKLLAAHSHLARQGMALAAGSILSKLKSEPGSSLPLSKPRVWWPDFRCPRGLSSEVLPPPGAFLGHGYQLPSTFIPLGQSSKIHLCQTPNTKAVSSLHHSFSHPKTPRRIH